VTLVLLPEHSGEHVRLRDACSRVRQGKGSEQTEHVFQNGYTLFALKCLCVLECVRSASFNEAAMVSGDDLVRTISEKTVGGIAVWVDVDLLDGLPSEVAMIHIVAECETTFNKSVVRFPPMLRQDLRVLREAPEDVVDAVTDLEAGFFDGRGGPVRGAGDAPDEGVAAWLEHPEALGHHKGEPANEQGTGLQVILLVVEVGLLALAARYVLPAPLVPLALPTVRVP